MFVYVHLLAKSTYNLKLLGYIICRRQGIGICGNCLVPWWDDNRVTRDCCFKKVIEMNRSKFETRYAKKRIEKATYKYILQTRIKRRTVQQEKLIVEDHWLRLFNSSKPKVSKSNLFLWKSNSISKLALIQWELPKIKGNIFQKKCIFYTLPTHILFLSIPVSHN